MIYHLALTSGDELAEHIQDLTEIVSLMTGGLSAEEKAAVNKAILQTYKEHSWFLNPSYKTKKKKKKKDPRGKKPKAKTHLILKDFYEELKHIITKLVKIL